MRRLAVPFALAALVASLALAAVYLWPLVFAPQPHAAILITIDALRPDRLGAYGYAEARTPAIDRLAAEGARFSTAYCDTPWTTGSMASVMTGTYGSSHGVRFGWQRLRDEHRTLAEVLKEHGLVTGAVVGSFPLATVYNLDQGFDSYNDEFSEPVVVMGGSEPVGKVEVVLSEDREETDRNFREKLRNDAYRPDEEVTRVAVEWLEQHHSERFFLWVHYFGPHERLLAGGHQRQRVLDDYDRDLANTDEAVGRLLGAIDALNLTASTLVVLHADHGQSLGEHIMVGHGYDLSETSVRIPLILRYPPMIVAGTRIATLARNVDIMPTVLDALGLDPTAGLAGHSLVPALKGRTAKPAIALMGLTHSPPVPVVVPGEGEFFAPTRVEGARIGQWKYIRTTLAAPCVRATEYTMGIVGLNPEATVGGTALPDDECGRYSVEQLYDVDTGSAALSTERDDLAVEHHDLIEQLRTLVDGTFVTGGVSEDFELTDEQKAKLRSLGYLQ